ncbi:MAG: hypothetical protein K0R65_2427 [Crocinitomicaceae bacterium]|jgi:hypothetical protein|nr:hypothetical protein [Crocinitomicaceae bacterium]
MYQEDRLITKIETDKVIVGLRGDDIVHVYYKRGTILNPELQDLMVGYFNEIAGNRKLPFIFEADVNVGVTREARYRALQIEDQTPISCTAIYAQNFIYKLLGDFYLLINRPKCPYMVFTDFQHAIDWLQKMHHKIMD